MSPLQATVSALVFLAAACSIWRLWPSVISPGRVSGEAGRRRKEAIQESPVYLAIDTVIRVMHRPVARLCPMEILEKADIAAQRAGYPAGLDGTGVVGVSLLGAVGLAATGGLLSAWVGRGMGAGMITGCLIGAILPWFKLQDIAKQRTLSIARGLPGVIDLIVLSMESGLDFPGAVEQVSLRLGSKNPIRFELEHILQKLALGRSRRDALEDLAERVPILSVRQFVAAVIQAERRGTPLVDVLGVQAEVMRTKRSQAAEQAAARAGILLLLPLMLIFISVFAIVLGPFVVKYVRGELF